MNKKQADKEKAIEYLAEYDLANTRVNCRVNHVSASGMSRVVGVYVNTEYGIYNISHLIARAAGLSYDEKNHGIKVGGCGFNAADSVISHLSWAMFGEDYKIKYSEFY